jgi:hypothetical protein
VKGHHILFCKHLDAPNCICLVVRWWLYGSYVGLGWDDECPGLVATLAREEEWQ